MRQPAAGIRSLEKKSSGWLLGDGDARVGRVVAAWAYACAARMHQEDVFPRRLVRRAGVETCVGARPQLVVPARGPGTRAHRD